MKRLTHAELAQLHDAQNWSALWEQALPLVKLAIRKTVRSGTLRTEDADDDLLQEGMLIAGEALRSWRPLECAFSTHLVMQVRNELLKHAARRANGGIGSYEQQPVVLSLNDEREDAPQKNDEGQDDDGDDGTFEACMTYEGVVKRGGQIQGNGHVPEGYGEPGIEAARINTERAVSEALSRMPPSDRELVHRAYGIGCKPQSPAEISLRTAVPLRTVERRLSSAKAMLAVLFPNSYHLN